MSFPITPILDSFDRTNGSLGANWTTQANVTVASNAMTISGTPGFYTLAWLPSTYGPDSEVYAKIATLTGAVPGVIVVLRSNDAQTTGYALQVLGSGVNQAIIVRLDTGATLTSVSLTPANNDLIGLRAMGSEITAWHKPSASNWRRILLTSSALFTSAGKLGVQIQSDPGVAADDFGGGTMPNPPGYEVGQTARAGERTFR